jgi:hypothetical protein
MKSSKAPRVGADEKNTVYCFSLEVDFFVTTFFEREALASNFFAAAFFEDLFMAHLAINKSGGFTPSTTLYLIRSSVYRASTAF